MSRESEVSSVGIEELDRVFNNTLRYIRPFMMANNVIEFAPRDRSNPKLIRSKTMRNTDDQGSYSMALEKPTPKAEEIYLTGEVTRGDIITPIFFFITKHGVLDTDGNQLNEYDESHLVNLLYKFFQDQDPHHSTG